MTTPLDLAVQRELADLRDEITRRPPALVSLDTLDRLATAVEGVAQHLAALAKPTATEPIGYTVASIRRSGVVEIDAYAAHPSVAGATAELHGPEYRGVPSATVVALVPVVTE